MKKTLVTSFLLVFCLNIYSETKIPLVNPEKTDISIIWNKTIDQASYSNNKKLVFISSGDSSAIIDAEKREIVLSFDYACYLFIFSSNSKFFITEDNKGNIRVWDLKEKEEIFNFKPEIEVKKISVSPDGLHAILVNQNSAYLWNLQDFSSSCLFEEEGNLLNDLYKKNIFVFSPSGKFYTITMGNFGFLKDFQGNTVLNFSDIQSKEITSVCFSPSEKYILVSYRDIDGYYYTHLYEIDSLKLFFFPNYERSYEILPLSPYIRHKGRE